MCAELPVLLSRKEWEDWYVHPQVASVKLMTGRIPRGNRRVGKDRLLLGQRSQDRLHYSSEFRRSVSQEVSDHADASHLVYRDAMRKHLHNITLRHWDSDMRILGAKALSALVLAGSEDDLSTAIDTEVRLDVTAIADSSDSHGIFSRPRQHTWRAFSFARARLRS